MAVLSILPCGFCSCVPFSPYHCHWHGRILGFVSTVLTGSWFVTTETHSLYFVPFRHLWNQFHLFSFVATEKCAHHPGSSLILNFPCSFYFLNILVLILALVCVVSVLELVMPAPCGDKVPALSDLVASKSIDLLGITETWLTTKETSADLVDMTPEGSSFFHKSRTQRRGGGVGLFVSSAHKLTAISLPT